MAASNLQLSESDYRTLIDLLGLLTYMSIRQEWMKFVQRRELFMLDPLDGDPNGRTIVLSPEINELLNREMEEGKEANRRSRLLATLQNIVTGRRLVVCLEPFCAGNAHIGLLSPITDSVFDIRCQDKPAVRVFCRFLEKDVLFAATCRPRSVEQNWLRWLPLNGRNSKEWERGIAATKREWNKFFPTYSPVMGGCLNDYLSNATHERARGRS